MAENCSVGGVLSPHFLESCFCLSWQWKRDIVTRQTHSGPWASQTSSMGLSPHSLFLLMGKCLDYTSFLYPATLGLFPLWGCPYAQVRVHVPSSAARMSFCVCLQATCKGSRSSMAAHSKNKPQKWVEEAEVCGELEVPMGDGYMCVFLQGVACRLNILINASGRGRRKEKAGTGRYWHTIETSLVCLWPQGLLFCTFISAQCDHSCRFDLGRETAS